MVDLVASEKYVEWEDAMRVGRVEEDVRRW